MILPCKCYEGILKDAGVIVSEDGRASKQENNILNIGVCPEYAIGRAVLRRVRRVQRLARGEKP